MSAYTTNEKSTGLEVLTTLASGDLHIVGDVSDSGRAKAITEDDLETTIANSTNFTDALIANTTFTQGLANDNTFVNTLANNGTFVTDLTNNSAFQTQVNNFVSGGGGGGGRGGGAGGWGVGTACLTGGCTGPAWAWTSATRYASSEAIPGMVLGSAC